MALDDQLLRHNLFCGEERICKHMHVHVCRIDVMFPHVLFLKRLSKFWCWKGIGLFFNLISFFTFVTVPLRRLNILRLFCVWLLLNSFLIDHTTYSGTCHGDVSSSERFLRLMFKHTSSFKVPTNVCFMMKEVAIRVAARPVLACVIFRSSCDKLMRTFRW